jgi:hypothetical protein
LLRKSATSFEVRELTGGKSGASPRSTCECR